MMDPNVAWEFDPNRGPAGAWLHKMPDMGVRVYVMPERRYNPDERRYNDTWRWWWEGEGDIDLPDQNAASKRATDFIHVLEFGARMITLERKILEALEEIVDREFATWDYNSPDSMWCGVNMGAIDEHYPFINSAWVEDIWDAPCSSTELQNKYIERWRAQFS